MTKFLVIYTKYSTVQLAIFNDNKLQNYVEEANKKISKDFIILVKNLLEKNKLRLEDLDFIAAHQGPAPFTTLRVSLASVNGLAFATKIPLVGVNGLETFTKEYSSQNYKTIALLNAFCEDIYYGILDKNNFENIITGCSKYYNLLNELKDKSENKIKFIGNGVKLYKNYIEEIFKDRAYIPEYLPLMASLEAIGIQAYKNWLNQKTTNQLLPLYLKAHAAQINKKQAQKAC